MNLQTLTNDKNCINTQTKPRFIITYVGQTNRRVNFREEEHMVAIKHKNLNTIGTVTAAAKSLSKITKSYNF